MNLTSIRPTSAEQNRPVLHLVSVAEPDQRPPTSLHTFAMPIVRELPRRDSQCAYDEAW